MWRPMKRMGVQIDQVPGILQEASVGGLKLHITLLVPPCPNILWLSKHLYDYKNQLISGQSEWLRLHEGIPLSRREASLRRTRARRFRDHFGTVSVRFKVLPLYVLVSPSPVSRHASRVLWRSISPSTIVVFKLRTSPWAHALCPQIS